MTLGRGSACDIRLCGESRDLNISRRHCQLTFDPPKVCVDDLGSANGTYVNGQHCAPLANITAQDEALAMAAQDGDILTIGGTSLQISVIDCPQWDDEERIKQNCPTKC
jgi:pSer/pThr/pTyr-binding forkhead associated (FHA) protein